MATHDFDKIYATKKSAEGRLLAIPGVHGVGLGAKYVGGERTREPAIMVFVEKKKSVETLLPFEIIPAEIDGLKTDVLESAPPRLMAEDTGTYRPLIGGVQLRGRGSLTPGGTLGCIARTNGPVPTIVGITNQHVVGIPPGSAKTELTFAIHLPGEGEVDDAITFTNANTAGSLIVVDWAMTAGGQQGQRNVSFYTTSRADTLDDIAAGVARAITSVAGGLTASALGPRVTINATAAGALFVYQPRVFGPHGYFEEADLYPSITHDKIDITRHQITLKGKAADHYGIFTNWNSGGKAPTRGVFTSVRKGTELAQVAADIATAINGRASPGIQATATEATVAITGPQHVECDISSDVRIGQATDCFCEACCLCCGHLVGVVKDARIDLDAAVIELAGKLQYRAEIAETGFIKGTRTYTLSDLLGPQPIGVSKRGARTGLTIGLLTAINHVGFVGGEGVGGLPHFHRFYANALMVTSKEEFSDRGDSGSAIVNTDSEVIGILFGGGDKSALATPIGEIEAAFDVSVVTATAEGQVNTVPATQGHALSMIEHEPLFVGRLRDIERELTATPEGSALGEVGRRHADEVVRLVNHNRRVGTVWRRNGGPELVQIALTLAHAGEKQVPQQINGRPLADCLKRMQEILVRYGSAQLAADLRRYGPRIIDLTRLDYPQLLTALAAAP